MKNTIKTIFIALLTVLVVGCEHDQVSEGFLNNRDSFVFFSRSSGNYLVEEEDAQPFNVRVGVSAPKDVSRNVVIEINPASTAVEGEDFEFTSSTNTIGSGLIVQNIEVLGNFDNLTEEKVLILDIIDFDEAIDQNRSRFRLVMNQSCPKEADGTYTGTTAIGDNAVSSGFDVELEEVDVNVYQVDNAWGDFVAAATGDPGFAGQFPYTGTLEIACDNTVEFIGEAPLSGGEGTYDEETGVIVLTLNQALFENDFQVTVTLTPNESDE